MGVFKESMVLPPTEHRQAAPEASNLFNQSHKHTTVTKSETHNCPVVDTLPIRPLQVLLSLLTFQMHQCTQFPQAPTSACNRPAHHLMLVNTQSQLSASRQQNVRCRPAPHTPRRRGGEQQPSHIAVWPANKGRGLLSQHAMHGTHRGACGQFADPLCKGTVR